MKSILIKYMFLAHTKDVLKIFQVLQSISTVLLFQNKDTKIIKQTLN